MKFLILLISTASFIICSAVAQDCPHGDGDYCGSYVHKTSNYLYSCTGGEWKMEKVCDYGCFVASAGNADFCLSAPDANLTNDDGNLYGKVDFNSGSCPQGHSGDYCGSLVGKDPSKLYSCHGAGAWSIKETCEGDCKATPSGHNDYCVSTGQCKDGNGHYCGRAIGKEAHHLYECRDGVYLDRGLCPNGCAVTSNGDNDYCYKQSDSVPGFFINAYTVHMLKKHEGFHKKFYKDEEDPQYMSIGYGHMCKPTIEESDCNKLPLSISETEATIILGKDIKPYEKCICDYVSVKLNDNQYGVLVAHTFERQYSCQYFRVSNLRTLVNKGEFDKVPQELLSYAKQNSEKSQQRYKDLADAWSRKSYGEVVCPPNF